jgi:hypothetical protein
MPISSISLPARRLFRATIAFTLGVAAVSTVSVLPAQATAAPAAAPALTCNTAARIFSVRPGGALAVYPHEEPETGAATYGPIREIGSGWDDVRTLAAPDGVLYQLHGGAGGNIYRYRWNGTGWDTWGGKQFRDVGGGWARFVTPEYRNRVTVDEKGRIFQIGTDGLLRVYIWSGDHATGSFAPGRVVDAGWGQYNMIAAGGDGVLYARKTATHELFRFRWHAESDRFVQYGLRVGTNWQSMTRLTSAGGDVLYATRDDGLLFWYRYYEDTNTWAGRAKEIGQSWKDEIEVTADPSACRVTGFPNPVSPAITQRFDAPNAAVEDSAGLVTFFYVNSISGLTMGKQRYKNDFSLLELYPVVDYYKFSGRPAANVRADGRIEALANSYDDAVYRGNRQATAAGPWGPNMTPILYRGWLAGDPVMLPDANKNLVIYGVDADGSLWHRTQVTAAGDYAAWRQISAAGSATSDFTVVRNGNGVDIVTRLADGTVQTASYAAGVLSAWRAVGTGATDRPAVVVHSNGDLQIFVRTTDGTVAAKRETNGAFPQAWQHLPGVTAAGSPAAALRQGSLVELAVRGTDNYVYQASELAPAGGYSPWEIKHLEETVTDPIAFVLSTGNPIFSWRRPDSVLQTSYIRTTSQAGTAPAFSGSAARSQS